MKTRWWVWTILVIGIAVWWNHRQSDSNSAENMNSAENQSEHETGLVALSDVDPKAMGSRAASGVSKERAEGEAGSDTAASRNIAGSADPEEAQRRQDALRDLFQRWGSGEWDFQVGDNGEVFRVLGGELRGIGQSEEDLRRFASEFAGVYGVAASEVDRIELNDEGATSVVDFPQQFEKDGEEYEVYQSWLRTIIHPETGDGILVLNELKPVNRDEVVVPAPIPMEEARQIVSQHLGGQAFRILEERGNLVWASSRPHQSAYEFWVDMEEDTRRIVVGAQARVVLSDESTRHF